MGQYYAVHRANGSGDELTHWKYIKKIKRPNGKTRYIYDQSELDKYNNEVVEKKEYTKDGRDVTEETTYKKSNSFFDGKSTLTVDGSMWTLGGPSSRYSIKSTTKTQGKLSRAQAKAEKWIFDTFLKKPLAKARYPKRTKNTSLKSISSKTISAGKAKLSQLFTTVGTAKATKSVRSLKR